MRTNVTRCLGIWFLSCILSTPGNCQKTQKLTHTEPYPGYCLTTQGEPFKSNKNQSTNTGQQVQVDGKILRIEFKTDTLLAFIEGVTRHIHVAWESPINYKVKGWAISPGGTIWITNHTSQYQGSISYKNGYVLVHNLKLLPPVYESACRLSDQASQWLDGGCSLSSPTYSATLDKAFISGFGKSYFSAEPILLELSSRNPPKLHQGMAYLLDAKSIGGVILINQYQQPIFYNGLNMKTLMSKAKQFSDTRVDKSWISDRYIIRTADKAGETIFLEIRPNGTTRQIKTGNPTRVTGIFFALPEAEHLMSFQSNGIYFDDAGAWRIFLAPQHGWQFENMHETTDDRIALDFSATRGNDRVFYRLYKKPSELTGCQ